MENKPRKTIKEFLFQKKILGVHDMYKRKFPNEMCTKCHNDMDKVKAKTVFDNKGQKVNPHDSHVGEQNCNECHSMHRQSTVMCTECHVQPWIKNLPDDWKKGK